MANYKNSKTNKSVKSNYICSSVFFFSMSVSVLLYFLSFLWDWRRFSFLCENADCMKKSQTCQSYLCWHNTWWAPTHHLVPALVPTITLMLFSHPPPPPAFSRAAAERLLWFQARRAELHPAAGTQAVLRLGPQARVRLQRHVDQTVRPVEGVAAENAQNAQPGR